MLLESSIDILQIPRAIIVLYVVATSNKDQTSYPQFLNLIERSRKYTRVLCMTWCLRLHLNSLGASPAVTASQAAHKYCHRLIRTARLQCVMCGLGALATAAAELSSFVGVDAVGLENRCACDFVQVPTAREICLAGAFFALSAHLLGGQLGGAEVCEVLGL